MEEAAKNIEEELVVADGGAVAGDGGGGGVAIVLPVVPGPGAAAEEGEAAVDEDRLARARAVLVAGAKFSGTIEIPGIHDGLDEQEM